MRTASEIHTGESTEKRKNKRERRLTRNAPLGRNGRTGNRKRKWVLKWVRGLMKGTVVRRFLIEANNREGEKVPA
ncbi:glutathione S-transferase family protein [Sesbania bispinosa]|nr:glutathione S-transferase family protein [Sesbania bispinosa]